MATVTKLKAAVNNKNLSILGEDGNIYTYYVGRYINKMSELGYTLTSTELQAVNTFVNAGISDGWIDKVPYFMPFIGTETTPLQGMVPLIDNIADYELAANSTDNLFSFENGKIKSFGGSSNCNGKEPLPFTTFDFGITQSFSVFVNVNYLAANGDDEAGIKGTFCHASDSDNVARFILRKGSNSLTSTTICKRMIAGEDVFVNGIDGTAYSEDTQLCIFGALYVDPNNTINRIIYSLSKGSSTSISYFTRNIQVPQERSTYMIGGTRDLTTVTNCLAVLKPQNVTASDLDNFSRAVFALTTALGRDVPTT